MSLAASRSRRRRRTSRRHTGSWPWRKLNTCRWCKSDSQAWAEKIEFWHIKDAPEVLAQIEREVMDLAARLIGGGRKRVAPPENAVAPVVAKQETPKKNAPVVRLGRQTKGRRGKGVTTVSDVPLDEVGLLELATKLKDRCGTGGTVKDGVIEIQGDQRDRLAAVLEGMGYKVKRVGG